VRCCALLLLSSSDNALLRTQTKLFNTARDRKGQV
jgi:hypothetical protein